MSRELFTVVYRLFQVSPYFCAVFGQLHSLPSLRTHRLRRKIVVHNHLGHMCKFPDVRGEGRGLRFHFYYNLLFQRSHRRKMQEILLWPAAVIVAKFVRIRRKLRYFHSFYSSWTYLRNAAWRSFTSSRTSGAYKRLKLKFCVFLSTCRIWAFVRYWYLVGRPAGDGSYRYFCDCELNSYNYLIKIFSPFFAKNFRIGVISFFFYLEIWCTAWNCIIVFHGGSGRVRRFDHDESDHIPLFNKFHLVRTSGRLLWCRWSIYVFGLSCWKSLVAYIGLYSSTEFLFFCSSNFYFCFQFLSFYCSSILLVEAEGDEIQLVTAGSGADVATDVKMRMITTITLS